MPSSEYIQRNKMTKVLDNLNSYSTENKVCNHSKKTKPHNPPNSRRWKLFFSFEKKSLQSGFVLTFCGPSAASIRVTADDTGLSIRFGLMV